MIKFLLYIEIYYIEISWRVRREIRKNFTISRDERTKKREKKKKKEKRIQERIEYKDAWRWVGNQIINYRAHD